MALNENLPLISAGIAFAGLLTSIVGVVLVVLQLRKNTKQLEQQSQFRVYAINRELITLGFSHRELFNVMADKEIPDAVVERRYLQLWLNQFSQIYSYMYESIFKPELKDSLTRDISDFFEMENMQRHWRHHGSFYPLSFQKFVNDIIKKNEPPQIAAAQMTSGC